jgi:hypothetical protein
MCTAVCVHAEFVYAVLELDHRILGNPIGAACIGARKRLDCSIVFLQDNVASHCHNNEQEYMLQAWD